MDDKAFALELQIALKREQVAHMITQQQAHAMKAELLRYGQIEAEQALQSMESKLQLLKGQECAPA